MHIIYDSNKKMMMNEVLCRYFDVQYIKSFSFYQKVYFPDDSYSN